jgi:serine/threonine-protein kinase
MTDGEPLAFVDPLIGMTIYGSYVITKRIAAGGMGVVYLATTKNGGGKKVIKFLLAEYKREQSIRQRFEREGKAAMRLAGKPHIVKVDDTLELPDGSQFMVMEWLDGKTLESHLRQSGHLAAHSAFFLALQIGAGLHELHHAGLIHRDLKPGNIFLTTPVGEYYVTLIDLGIAYDAIDLQKKVTRTGAALGTPGYMSPEQYSKAGSVTPAADVYALGVVLYEMLVGRVPWIADDQFELYDKQRNETPIIPEDVAMPAAWRAILLRALSVRPKDRHQTVVAFLFALASELPADPALALPNGATMMAQVTPQLLRNAPSDTETVRAHGDERARLMFTPPRLTFQSGLGRAVATAAPPPGPATPVLPATANARPLPSPDGSARAGVAHAIQEEPAASPSTITALSGVVSMQARPALTRWGLVAGVAFVIAIVAGLGGGIAYLRLSSHAKAHEVDAAKAAPSVESPPVMNTSTSPVTATVSMDAGIGAQPRSASAAPSAAPSTERELAAPAASKVSLEPVQAPSPPTAPHPVRPTVRPASITHAPKVGSASTKSPTTTTPPSPPRPAKANGSANGGSDSQFDMDAVEK